MIVQSRHFFALPGHVLTDTVQSLSRPAGLQAAQHFVIVDPAGIAVDVVQHNDETA